MQYSIFGLRTSGRDPTILGVSVVGICSSCGTPWLRLQIAARDWRGFTVACPDCASWPFDSSIAGSILSVVGPDMLPYLPPEVLQHEFEVHLRHFEKGMV